MDPAEGLKSCNRKKRKVRRTRGGEPKWAYSSFLKECVYIFEHDEQKKWSESEVTLSCPTLFNSMDCSLPASSVHGILQARILEWVAISFSRGSSQPRDQTRSLACRQMLYCLSHQGNQKNSSLKKWSNLSSHINPLYSKGLTLPKEMFVPLPLASEKTTKKAKCQRIIVFIFWYWGRLLRIPWTARRSNQSIQEEINPEYSLERLLWKLKLQYFGSLMQRNDSLEKTLMLRKIEGRRRKLWPGDS